MKRWKVPPKYLSGLLGSILVVMVVQYSLMTGLIRPVNLVFQVIQVFCYLLLAVSIFRGVLQRSRLAWLVVQTMLSSLFAFSLLFTTISGLFTLRSQGLGILLTAALVTAVVNGLLLGILFSLPVCDYFSPKSGVAVN